MKKRVASACFLAGLLVSLGGCGDPTTMVGALLYVFGPDQSKKTIEPECDVLPKHSVAVAIYADPKVMYEYPGAKYELSSAICSELAKNVKETKVLDYRKILAYQAGDLQWDAIDRTELGKKLGADYLLYVTMIDFTTHEPGSATLMRGIIRAEVELHDCSKPERTSIVWRCTDFEIRIPENAPVTQMSADDRILRAETVRRFSDQLAKKFYKHEEPTGTLMGKRETDEAD